MIKLLRFVIFIFLILLLWVTPAKANTLYDINSSDCVGSMKSCDSYFTKIVYGSVTKDSSHQMIFTGQWARINYSTRLTTSPINISVDIPIIDSMYEMSVNTPANVFNSYISTRITVSSGNVQFLAYKMDPFGDNYSNLSDNPLDEYVTSNLGSFTPGKYYHFQTIYDGSTLYVYFDNSLVFTKSVSFIENYYNVAFMGGNATAWRNLLITDNAAEPSPTPLPTETPIPTLSPTPSLTPTPTMTPSIKKVPIIIIPGFMSSWNGEAVLHNRSVSQSDWKLAPYIHEYQGLVDSLEHIGYLENEDFFIFAYDWRRKIEETVDDLNIFIKEKIGQDKKVNIVGHSLGGLVARIYSQKYLSEKNVEKIVSVGSPHFGVVQVYKPIEAGEIDRENTWLWLMEKIIVNLNRNLFESDKEVIQKLLPVVYDLFPTFDFIINEADSFIDINSLKTFNFTLKKYNSDFDSIFPFFYSILGEKDSSSTPAGFKINKPTITDNLFNNYEDGHPIDTYRDKGDYTVLSRSAKAEGDDFYQLPLDHGELIYEKAAIEKIFDIFGVRYAQDDVVEGKKTKISPSLIFFIKSPATIEVNFQGKTYSENDGVIFIDNATSGNYQIKVKGNDLGKYNLLVGQIAENNDIWEEVEGKISTVNQVDDYFINFDNYFASLQLNLTETYTNSLIDTPTPTVPTSTLTSTSDLTLQSTISSMPTTLQSTNMPTKASILTKTNPSKVLGTKTKIQKQKPIFFSFTTYAFPITLVVGIINHLIRKKISM